MATLRQLKRKAKELGHKMTPHLEAELRVLAAVPDDVLERELRDTHHKILVREMAQEFQVPVAAMEQRIGERTTP